MIGDFCAAVMVNATRVRVEAANFAAHRKLNLTAIIDCNQLQGVGFTKDARNGKYGRTLARLVACGRNYGHNLLKLNRRFRPRPPTLTVRRRLSHTRLRVRACVDGK